MTATRKITVERNRLRFAAAHMATFLDDCEPLHGHNYDVIVEIEGELTEDAWVWDFGSVKKLTKAIIDELDHRFILQRTSMQLEIEELPTAWRVRYRNREYVFPRSDVVALPIENSTAELIAEWINGRLLAELQAAGATTIRRVGIGVEEMPGQAGWSTVDV